MSYVLSSILVDIAEVSSVIGCKDPSVIDAVKSLERDRYDEEATWDPEVMGEISLGDALRHLVMGEPLDAGSAHQYGYALCEVCTYMGTLLQPDCWSGVRWSAIEDCGLVELMTTTGPPVPLPSIEDFPRIGHIRRDQLPLYLDAATTKATAVSDVELKELLDEFIGWLETAIDNSVDIVLIYH